MRPIAVSARSNSDYILESNRSDNPEEQTVFELRGSLTLLVRQRILDAMSLEAASNKVSPEMGTRNVLACKHGIANWKNFQDGAGNEVPCEHEGSVVKDSSIEKLTDVMIMELGGEIIERSQLTQKQAEK